MSLRRPSLHSVTRQFTVPVVTPMSGLSSSMYWVRASQTVPTLRVLVRRMGVSMVPSSSIWMSPTLLPKPLITDAPAITFSRKQLPPWGSTAVTPVWTSPPFKVAWPTLTPGTSVMRSRGPRGHLACRSRPLCSGSPIGFRALLSRQR